MNQAIVAAVATVFLGAMAAGAEPPHVVRCTPDNGEVGVDPGTAEVRIEFDQDMGSGASVCGGGPRFPKLTGKVRWESPRVCVVPVALAPETVYEFGVNCPAYRNFRGVNGESAEIEGVTFRTGAVGAVRAAALTREQNERAVGELRRLIDERYSYRDRMKVDWPVVFKGAEEGMLGATSPAMFARAASRMLSAAQDAHLNLKVGDGVFGTLKRDVKPNVDIQRLGKAVPQFKQRNQWVWTGRFEDGVGYILITGLPGAEAGLAPAHAALDEMADAKGLVIDVRANGGGDEPAAQRFAARFVKERAVYSRNRYRDGKGEWGPVLERVIEPGGKSFDRPVAVLMGPNCMSSCESFLLIMRYGAKATLVGERSFGSSGNPKLYELGNGVSVLLPSWEDQLPDGSVLEGRGVAPDREAVLGAAAGRDGVLEMGLAVVRGER